MTLATEWKLLKENGQHNEAQRTLEELVLGLQAYRRLDITGNCLAAARYQEITDGFEADKECSGDPCLCPDKYKGDRWNFDSPCPAGCNQFVPQTDGYSGFFLREDATQALKPILHDPSEGKWNIGLIGGNAYSMSVSPPCTTSFSQTCYLVHRRGFMSQDGIFSLMMGLAMIKRFIPANVSVTTCEGVTFYPLQMAINIASAITNRVDNAYLNRIMWPGSDECCDKTVYLSEREGGRPLAEMHGLKKACSYIDGVERHSGWIEAITWGGLFGQTGLSGNTNEVFWLRLKTIGWDMGDDGARDLYESSCITEGMEILPLINNILYPDSDGSDIGIDKQQFQAMLCAAPCGGPCKKKADYPETADFPEFECANNPGWPGQRWERGKNDTDASDENRQFNGLDFMALHNLYLLYFPEERTAYFNPDRPAGNVNIGFGNIQGPNILCQGDQATYEVIILPEEGIPNLTWTSSSNLTITGPPDFEVKVKAGAPIYTPMFVQAAFTQNQEIPQFFDGQLQGTTVADFCEMTYRKPIYSLVPGYGIAMELNHCQGIYDFHAVCVTPELPGSTYTWNIKVQPVVGAIVNKVLTGKDPHISQSQWLPEKSGNLLIKLAITTPCGNTDATFGGTYNCGSPYQLIVAPNPATNRDEVTVQISQDKDYVVGTEGVEVNFIRTGRGNVQKTQRIYQNGQSVSIANFPAGNYTVQAMLADKSVLTTTLVVSEK